MIALVAFTRRVDIMGGFANSRLLNGLAVAGAAFILGLNIVLLVQMLG